MFIRKSLCVFKNWFVLALTAMHVKDAHNTTNASHLLTGSRVPKLVSHSCNNSGHGRCDLRVELRCALIQASGVRKVIQILFNYTEYSGVN